jgi:uncharacterized protein
MMKTGVIKVDLIDRRGGLAVSRRAFMRLSAAAAGLAMLRRASAQVGDPGASLVQQGRKYYEGTGAPADYKKAAELFQQAAAAGSQDGQAWLGSMYLRGHGVAQDDAKAVDLISGSAKAGSPVGLRFMGVLYQRGRMVPQDYAMARQFYEQAAAKGDAVACGRLGMLHLFGRGGRADTGKAKSYLSLGASGGDPWSMVELGMLYKHDGNQSDRVLAFEQYTQAAKLGNRVGAYRLAQAYHYGIGTEKDPVAVVRYLRVSASKGYPVAQAALGSLFESGITVEQDVERAYALYTLASRQGSRSSTMHLRTMAKQMTVQQIERATSLADAYQAKNPQRNSN